MIQTEDLSKQFGDFWAVDGVTLNVPAGQLLALLGPNGAGKTTTVRMLTSVLHPSRGRAVVAGYDVVEHPEKVRAAVGVLTEQHGLYTRMSAEEYLDFFGRVYRLDAKTRRARSHDLLEYFSLGAFARQPMGEYSKGMRQKLALARTLIHEPPVLLLDEPTSTMDPESAHLVREAILDLRSANRAIIICTHNLAEAEMLADQIAIIFRGRILMRGMVEELKQRLLGSAEYEVKVRGEWPNLHLDLPRGIRQNGAGGCGPRFLVEDPQAANPLLIQQLVAQHVPVVALQEVPRTLEQVYMKAMAQAGQDRS